MKKIYLLTILIFCIKAGVISAAPSGSKLVNVCEQALNDPSAEMESQMCEWYVTPCDCSPGLKSETPRVCLPDDFSSRTLAQLVIDGIKNKPGLLSAEASLAAASILSEKYPCSDNQ